jgi:hypothetical protein
MVDKQQIQEWLDKLRAGTLVEADLQQVLDRLDGTSDDDSPKQQRLLYLNTGNTGVDSQVLGMALVENGEILEGPDDVDEWPYNSVLEAMDDGWRIIKFPEMALLLQEDKTFGLGCEFILEKLT